MQDQGQTIAPMPLRHSSFAAVIANQMIGIEDHRRHRLMGRIGISAHDVGDAMRRCP
jgi:hypothetical protein